MSNKSLLPILAGLIVLSAGVFWFTRSGSDARGASGGSGITTSSAAGTRDRAPVALDAAGATTPGAEAPASRAERAVAAPVEAAQPEVAAAAPAELRVVGRVVDEGARPVSGTEVRLRRGSAGSRFFGGDDEVPDLIATSNSDGHFRFEGVEPGTARLLLRAKGFAPKKAADLSLPDAERHDLGTFTLAPGALLSGRVVDAAGRPVAGAELMDVGSETPGSFFGNADSEPSAMTGADGSFRVEWMATGTWSFVVRAEGLPTKYFTGEALDPGVDAGPVELRLPEAAGITGHVIAAEGTELTSLKVVASTVDGSVFRMRGSEDSRRRFLERSLGLPLESEVASDGAFRIDGLVSGVEYRLNAVRDTGRRGWGFGGGAAGAIADAGATDVEVLYESRGGLVFRVVDEDGAPVEALRANVGGAWNRAAVRDAEGEVQRFFPGGLVEVPEVSSWGRNVSLQIQAQGFATYEEKDLELVPGELTDLGDLALTPVPVVHVNVVEAGTGRAVEGARVTLKPTEVGGDQFDMQIDIDDGETVTMGGTEQHREDTDERGYAGLSAFPGETCTLEVRSAGHAPWKTETLEVARSGDTQVAVELLAGGRVDVTVLDPEGKPVAGTRVRTRPPGEGGETFQVLGRMDRGGRFSSTTNGNGVAVFEHLSPGVHGFLLANTRPGGGVGFVSMNRVGGGGPSQPEESWVEVEVVEGGEHALTLESQPVGTLVGTVLQAGSPLSGAEISLREKREGGSEGFGGMRMMSFGGAGGGDATRSDGRGRYSIDDLTVGEYVLTVDHPRRAMPAEFDVLIAAGENRFDPALTLAIITGRITDLDGEPLGGVRVEAERAPDPDAPRQRTMAFAVMIEADEGGAVTLTDDGQVEPGYTDADGNYELRGVTSGVDLVVRASGGDVRSATSEPVKLTSNEVKSGVDLELEAAGRIVATVVNAKGQEMGFSFVRAEPLDAEDDVEGDRGMSDEKGEVSLGGLTPGRYEVWATNFQSGGETPREVVDVEPRAKAEVRLVFPE